MGIEPGMKRKRGRPRKKELLEELQALKDKKDLLNEAFYEYFAGKKFKEDLEAVSPAVRLQIHCQLAKMLMPKEENIDISDKRDKLDEALDELMG